MICTDGLPDTYGGTFSGSSVDTEATRSWHGTVTFKRVKPPDPRAAQCDGRGVACYDVTAGIVTWETSTTPGGQCVYQSGPKSVSLTPGQGVLNVDASGSETPGYSGGFAVLDLTTGTSQCDPSFPPEDQTFILADCCWASNAGMPWGDFGENGGLTLRGTRTTGDSTYRVTHNWDFTGQ